MLLLLAAAILVVGSAVEVPMATEPGTGNNGKMVPQRHNIKEATILPFLHTVVRKKGEPPGPLPREASEESKGLKQKPYLLRPYLAGLDGLEHGGMRRVFNNSGSHQGELTKAAAEEPLQQDLNSRQFYEDIVQKGFEYTYQKGNGVPNPPSQQKTKRPKHVIIVGAGMAGLASGYELSQSGHEVTILELQQRVGGRIQTLEEPFARGLHAEGGAMRLPPTHYLTDHYLDLFNVKSRVFQNENTNAFYYFYGQKVKISDWNKRAGYYCDQFWKGWDAQICPETKKELGITGIQSYWDKTIEPVIQELEKNDDADGWSKWVKKWSRFSVEEFMKTEPDEKAPCDLRPWPPIAVEAFRVQKYSPRLDASLVEYLRDGIGKWQVDPLHTPVDGMSALPWAFTKKNDQGWNKNVDLSKNIQYGVRIHGVEINTVTGQVTVSGRNEELKQAVTFTGDAVILTVPLTVLRNMDVPLSLEKQRAIANVNYLPSTKIFLQCKTRFWQKYGIQGGFSKTNLPIGQLHYPDWDESGIPQNERGILLVYTWGQDSLMFGAQTHGEAIENAVKQVAKIHPEIIEEFEVGAVQAWSSDPTEQGGFVSLKPDQYNTAITELLQSDHPVYLAGEATSWSNGWIQGALESGLSAAYQFYVHNEKTAKTD